MSPVSRKRKPKKPKRTAKPQALPGAVVGTPPRHRTGAFAVFNPTPFHEPWFDAESKALVESAEQEWESWYDEDLPGLEDRASRAVGTVLLRHWKADHSSGNTFNPWLGHLAKAAANRAIALIRAGDDTWRGPACLLLGLGANRPSGLKAQADTAVSKLRKALDGHGWPEAFSRLAAERTEATGKAWIAVDGYGDRFGLVIQTATGIDEEEHYYLVAVEMASDNTATFAGSYSSLDVAFARWREHVGLSAARAEPKPVTSGRDLWFLMYLTDPGDITYDLNMGPVLLEYFRAQRRLEDLVALFRGRGLEIPAPVGLYRQDLEPDFEPFMDWLTERGWDEDAVGDRVFTLMNEWYDGTPPETVHAISPLRVAARSLTTLDVYDMGEDFKALMTEWIRYCAARTGLDGTLTEAAVAAVPADRDEAKKVDRSFEPPEED
ncbi:hypothetical protein [Glycomyces sp. YM15]|uniref:hypothetical protein n=1 Tax=Glycomyces sp. YM15 TaxID=2800446 RepID=UPI0019652215|nr:hypothetical protein [Glycomyces sp. YM15]